MQRVGSRGVDLRSDAEYAAGFEPRMIPAAHWVHIADFVRAAFVQANPAVSYPRGRLLSVLAAHTHWCWQAAGYDLLHDVIFDRRVIADSVRHAFADKAPSTQANARAMLLRVAEALNPDPFGVRLPPLARSQTSRPYTLAEQTELRAWADFQRTQSRRRDARALLALGIGAGLPTRELRLVRTEDVTTDDEGVLVRVPGRRERQVPLLRGWEAMLQQVVEASEPGAFLFRPDVTRGDNSLVGGFVTQTRSQGAGVSAPRMRATWIVTVLAAGVPARTLLDAAGVKSFDTFTRHLPYVAADNPRAARFSLRNAELTTPR